MADSVTLRAFRELCIMSSTNTPPRQSLPILRLCVMRSNASFGVGVYNDIKSEGRVLAERSSGNRLCESVVLEPSPEWGRIPRKNLSHWGGFLLTVF